jgi:hypothetical protein
VPEAIPSDHRCLSQFTDHLLHEVPWPDYTRYEQAMRRSHDTFDAVIAALTARIAARAQTIPPT